MKTDFCSKSTPRFGGKSPFFAHKIFLIVFTWLFTLGDALAQNMFWEVKGLGQNVLIVHGFPGNAGDWNGVFQELSQKNDKVFLPHLLGFGNSSKPVDFDDLWVDSQARSILDYLQKEGVEDVSLVAHDYGCPIAIVLYDSDPRRFKRLVLSSCAVSPNVELPFLMRLTKLPLLGNWFESMIFSRSGINTLRENSVSSQSVLPRENTDEELRSLRTVFATVLKDMYRFYAPIEAKARSIEAPVSLIWGDGDEFFDKKHAQGTLSLFKKGNLEFVKDSMHFPFLEKQAAYVDALEKVLKKD